MDRLKLIECPRDAMQGIKEFIDSDTKINYINSILKCGFDTVDFGSFVSPKAIPQMRDTETVLNGLNDSDSKLLAIVANKRGAEDASRFERISYLGYPFSVSEEFQRRNTNASIVDSFKRVEEIKNIADSSGKEVVLYLSMGLGNPYGENWHPDIVAHWSEKLVNELDIKIQAVSDTIGVGTQESVADLFKLLISELPSVEFGAHLHTRREDAQLLVESAYSTGCRRFDSAIKGYGGCPMAKDDLVGNLPTEEMLAYFNDRNINHGINLEAFSTAMEVSNSVFV